MPVCALCGQDNPARARFCMSCASPLQSEDPAPRGARKSVTVVFCDIEGSTQLTERLEPESARDVMARFFRRMRAALEHHGGTVEKYIGDAVMAVFGAPVLHEDDAFRAVRAAQAMREELEALNVELEVQFGVRLRARIGVNTGEVIVGDPAAGQALVVGDAVNVAARLEQVAPGDEILLGPATFALVRDDVSAEPTEPLELKGKTGSITAYRLVSVGPQRDRLQRREAPIVGRERELEILSSAFERASNGRSCEFVTILGSAGVGKSRLAREFTPSTEPGSILLRGRCLPYGDGITFWPIAALVRQVSHIVETDTRSDARRKIDAAMSGCPDGALISERVAGVTGFADPAPGLQETFWAIRRFLEWTGRDGPLVIVLDDLQWAEPTLLDLVEYIAGWSRDVPMLLLCLARPDLLDVRPTWGSGVAKPTILNLDPLDERESERLVSQLLGGTHLDDRAFARIADSAGGNPLFLEEILRMLEDDGLLQREGDSWLAPDLGDLRIPESIQALLGARLDRLSPDERLVIRSAAVVGKVFWWGAVEHLVPEGARSRVGSALQTLVRKDLIRPEPSTFAGEDAFRFHHILIQDAAYRGTPKEVRAQLHEAFANWLEGVAGDRDVELEEVIGYHLEQAYRYRSELAPITDRETALAARAGLRLSSAGIRALERRDVPAGADLLGRATALLPRDRRERRMALLALGEALEEIGDLGPAQAALEEAEALAKEAADEVTAANAGILRLSLLGFTDPRNLSVDPVREAERLITALSDLGDDLGLVRAWRLIGDVHWNHGRYASADEALAHAIEHARRAGATREEADALGRYVGSGVYGPAPVEEIERRCGDLVGVGAGSGYEAPAVTALAWVRAMQGRFDEARELVGRSRAVYEDLGLRLRKAFVAEMTGAIEMLAGEPVAAEREFKTCLDEFAEMGEQGGWSTVAAALAHALIEQGRLDEAEESVVASELAGAEDDVSTQVLDRSARARIQAGRGLYDEATKLARDAVVLSEATDDLNMRGDTLAHLGDVLSAAGETADASAAFGSALELFEAKGNTVAAAAIRYRLGELDRGTVTGT
jgi:class 3 adenylate cyclase/tetratricopeptide (TPR) repeat protein